MTTEQEKFWQSKFGREYINRNLFSSNDLDRSYTNEFGISRSKMNKEFLSKLKINNVLEVGSNIGNQLALLQKQGFRDLYGIEIYDKAIELSKTHTENINVIKGSALDIPFKNNFFDLVFTSGVLIHIDPKDLLKAIQEIHRVSKKYIWGFEYFSNKNVEINYRGNKNKLWKTDFVSIYKKIFPDLILVKQKKYNSIENPGEINSMFLFKKRKK